METKIWVYKNWVNISPDETVNSTRRLHSFCVFNCLRDSIFKTTVGYYMLTLDGKWKFVVRTLNNFTFQELYDLLTKN